MGMCKECNEIFNANDMVNGLCLKCRDPEKYNKQFKVEIKEQEIRETELEKLKTIIATTEMSINGLKIEKRIDLVSAQCVYGLNIFKDLFAGVRNIVGGRVKSIEDPLEEGTKIIIQTLKEKAYLAKGDVIIGIKIEHTYNNVNNGNMLSIYGTGTILLL